MNASATSTPTASIRRHERRRLKADRQQADPRAVPRTSGSRSAVTRAEPGGEVRRAARRVGHERRHGLREGAGDERRFRIVGHPWIGPERVEAESRGRLQPAVSRIVLEQQRADAAGHVERVLMELREELVRRRAVRQQRGERPLNDISGHPADAEEVARARLVTRIAASKTNTLKVLDIQTLRRGRPS